MGSAHKCHLNCEKAQLLDNTVGLRQQGVEKKLVTDQKDKMINSISSLPYYSRAFSEAVRTGGWRYALRRTVAFISGRVKLRLRYSAPNYEVSTPESVSPFRDIITTLEPTRLSSSLVLIISDIQIRQCVHYRIQQKLRYLKKIGLQGMHVFPAETGRIRAFLGLTDTVIIYRTALPPELLQVLRDSGVRILFEFDDLVVGPTALDNSGVLTQITDIQAQHLRTLSAELLKTARSCEAIIVSSTYLAQLYAKVENGLADKPCYVVPNFVETDHYNPPGKKNVTFAYTSPSGSIRDEMAMLTGFLASYDAAVEHDWSILIMGNDAARKELEKLSIKRGRIIGQPFSAFDEYLAAITRAETVLIPLADNDFNRSKTAIRLMDAVISGTQALFCPVGAYQSIQAALENDSLCIAPQAWPDAGATIAPILARQEVNVADQQQAVRQIYGIEAARSCYQHVFIEQLGISPAPLPEILAPS